MDEKFENTIEVNAIDTQYESFRLPDKRREQYLLASIAENGVQVSLQGIFQEENFILLDGFKRLRCVKKLKIHMLPFKIIANDSASGILKFLKTSSAKSLHIFEQAKLVEELRNVHQMSIRDIAIKLERSPAWVSVRISFLKDMPIYVQEQVYKGRFPVQSATHTLRQFIRINKIKRNEVEQFVKAVSGKGLSTRDVDLLARGYFSGGNKLKEQIQTGDLSWAISRLKEKEQKTNDQFNTIEQQTIRDLEIVGRYMNRLIFKLPKIKSESKPFIATVGLLTEGILSKVDIFSLRIKIFNQEICHDQCRKAEGNLDTLLRRDENQKDRSNITC